MIIFVVCDIGVLYNTLGRHCEEQLQQRRGNLVGIEKDYRGYCFTYSVKTSGIFCHAFSKVTI